MNKKRLTALGMAAVILMSAAVPGTTHAEKKASQSAIVSMETNRLESPLGIEAEESPVFGWAIRSEAIGVKQGSYQIVVREGSLEGPVVWDSGKVKGDDTQDITYEGKALKPETAYYWQVTSWDTSGREIAGSQDSFETGVDKESGWDGAKWIALDEDKVDYEVDSYTVSGKLRFDSKVSYSYASLVYSYQDVNHYYYMKFIQNADGTISYAPCVETGTTQESFRDTALMIVDETDTDFDPSKIPSNVTEDAAMYQILDGIQVGDEMEVEVHADLKSGKVTTSVNGKEVGSFSKPKYYYNSAKLKYYPSWNYTQFTKGFVLDAKDVELMPLQYGRVGMKQNANSDLKVAYDNIKVEAVRKGSDTPVVTYSKDFEDGVNAFNFGTVIENGNNQELLIQSHPGDYDLLVTQEDFEGQSAPMLRKKFSPKKEIATARIYSTALGLYDLYLNGERVGVQDDETGETVYDEMKPDWTVYGEKVTYNSYDVTDYLKTGENTLGVYLGTGWYQGRISRNTYKSDDLEFLAKMVVTYTDGSQDTIVTDESWQCYNKGPITSNDIWDGERYDAAKEVAWDDDTVDWAPVDDSFRFTGEIIPQIGETVRKVDELTDVELLDSSGDNTYLLYDFKQNFAGWENMEVEAAPGTRIEIRHGEMLNDPASVENGKGDGEVGTLYTANLRSAKAKEVYVVGDSGKVNVKAKFTFFGFRYLDIHASAPITVKSIKGEVIASNLDKTMEMTTNDEKVNQLIRNIYWSQVSNYLSVPTDCPQRDERWGYSGDANVFAGTSVYNMDVQNFMKRYSTNSYDAALIWDGLIPAVVPEVGSNDGYWLWSDSAIIVPWKCYMQYESLSYLEDSYKTMKGYMDYMEKTFFHGDGSVEGSTLGDHLAPGMSGGDYGSEFAGTVTSTDVLRHLIAAYDISIMEQTCRLLGYKEEAEKYQATYEKLKNYFKKTFVKEDGTLTDNTQGAYALAISLDMIDGDQIGSAADALQTCIEAVNDRITTGFISTNWLMPALSQSGKTDKAYDLLLQTMAPSWLYEVEQGATTIWERWNAYSAEGGFGDVSMNSFNHYSLGSVGEWMYGYMAGIISGDTPGYQEFVLQPIIDDQGRIDYVDGSYRSDYGTVRSGWRSAEGAITSYKAEVPANTTATLYLPITAKQAKYLDIPEGMSYVGMEKHNEMMCARYELVSGVYDLTILSGEEYMDQAMDKLTQQLEQSRQEAAEADRKAEEAWKAAEAVKKQAGENSKKAQEALEEARMAQKTAEQAQARLEKIEFTSRKPDINAVKSTKKRQLKISWKKVSGAEGYVLQYATKPNFKGKKAVTVKKGSTLGKSIRKLRSGKNYYVRMKAYRIISGKKVYTGYSGKKVVRVK